MLTASILKIFYYPGTHYDLALLIQAVVMVAVQLALLKVALDNRPSSRDGAGLPHSERSLAGNHAGTFSMPGGFWRWRQQRPYWQFLGAFAGALLAGHVLVRPGVARMQGYTQLLGAVGLAVEATLPLPQLYSNWRSRSCRGFRVSVLVNWLVGDAMKMSYFFLQGNDSVTWPFKACGCFQAVCDVGLGVQYLMYGDGVEKREAEGWNGIRMDERGRD